MTLPTQHLRTFRNTGAKQRALGFMGTPPVFVLIKHAWTSVLSGQLTTAVLIQWEVCAIRTATAANWAVKTIHH